MQNASAIKLKQNSKWQLYAITVKTYKDGTIYTEAEKLVEWQDLGREYMTVVFKRDYNHMMQIKRTNKSVEALRAFAKRYDTLSTSHACTVTRSYDNATIASVQGRDSYSILRADGNVLLVAPKGIYL